MNEKTSDLSFDDICREISKLTGSSLPYSLQGMSSVKLTGNTVYIPVYSAVSHMYVDFDIVGEELRGALADDKAELYNSHLSYIWTKMGFDDSAFQDRSKRKMNFDEAFQIFKVSRSLFNFFDSRSCLDGEAAKLTQEHFRDLADSGIL